MSEVNERSDVFTLSTPICDIAADVFQCVCGSFGREFLAVLFVAASRRVRSSDVVSLSQAHGADRSLDAGAVGPMCGIGAVVLPLTNSTTGPSIIVHTVIEGAAMRATTLPFTPLAVDCFEYEGYE